MWKRLTAFKFVCGAEVPILKSVVKMAKIDKVSDNICAGDVIFLFAILLISVGLSVDKILICIL